MPLKSQLVGKVCQIKAAQLGIITPSAAATYVGKDNKKAAFKRSGPLFLPHYKSNRNKSFITIDQAFPG
jgi:hypothetical protein